MKLLTGKGFFVGQASILIDLSYLACVLPALLIKPIKLHVRENPSC